MPQLIEQLPKTLNLSISYTWAYRGGKIGKANLSKFIWMKTGNLWSLPLMKLERQ